MSRFCFLASLIGFIIMTFRQVKLCFFLMPGRRAWSSEVLSQPDKVNIENMIPDKPRFFFIFKLSLLEIVGASVVDPH
ncbi:hypothetical protein AO261_18040 [Pseudomonas avellanae]|nr:hypothetical protein AO261_18040 [Pseudomonas avellanae]